MSIRNVTYTTRFILYHEKNMENGFAFMNILAKRIYSGWLLRGNMAGIVTLMMMLAMTATGLAQPVTTRLRQSQAPAFPNEAQPSDQENLTFRSLFDAEISQKGCTSG
ncbi:hypothetical protein [Novacetimonas pomaceti]|uniref:hypothetical protein n=1 Tax=Novacetimonas pomaceti TaxID=2021998 RepID=UPI0010577C87|nr:hypothetical protein [Novacetimonas pomaceti]